MGIMVVIAGVIQKRNFYILLNEKGMIFRADFKETEWNFSKIINITDKGDKKHVDLTKLTDDNILKIKEILKEKLSDRYLIE